MNRRKLIFHAMMSFRSLKTRTGSPCCPLFLEAADTPFSSQPTCFLTPSLNAGESALLYLPRPRSFPATRDRAGRIPGWVEETSTIPFLSELVVHQQAAKEFMMGRPHKHRTSLLLREAPLPPWCPIACLRPVAYLPVLSKLTCRHRTWTSRTPFLLF